VYVSDDVSIWVEEGACGGGLARGSCMVLLTSAAILYLEVCVRVDVWVSEGVGV